MSRRLRDDLCQRYGNIHNEFIDQLIDELGENRDAYSIPEFCTRHGISPAFYFLLQRGGRGPRVMSVGSRRLISREAAAEWRRECEQAAAEDVSAPPVAASVPDAPAVHVELQRPGSVPPGSPRAARMRPAQKQFADGQNKLIYSQG